MDDMGEKKKFELENKNEDPMNYSPGISSDWRFDGSSSLTNTSMGLVQAGNLMAIGKCDIIGTSSCSSAPMVDSFVPTLWDQPTGSQNLGFCEMGAQNNNVGTLNPLGIRKGSPASLQSGIDRTLDMSWNPSSSLLKGGIFLPTMPGMLPQSLSQLPADSAFIERAARFSFFNGGNFSDMVNPFTIPGPMGVYSRCGGGMMMHGASEALVGNGLRPVSGVNSQRNELNNANEASGDASVPVEPRAIEGSTPKNERKSESLVNSQNEAKQGLGGSGNESDEAEFSSGTGVGLEEPSMLEGTTGEPSSKGLGAKKRKRNGPDSDLDQAKGASQPHGESGKDNSEHQQKGDQNPSTTTNNKTTGKHGKQGSQASDPTKEEYIHVRARRGQATNSHSLAERVRREKISERMKFLQDLVPGCSKVTGKAVMLDEIINYVQSLQRQVEFLSMKLATVNPRLDFNIEGLLAKDMLQSRIGSSSSSLAFCPDLPMAYPALQPTQQGQLIQAGLPGMGSSSDMLRRTISSHLTPLPGGFKEPTQLPNVWEDELNNVVQMSFGTRTSPNNNQDVDGSLPASHMKVEL